MKVDLLLCGDLGLWVLRRTEIESVATVVTVDSSVAGLAASLGYDVVFGDANVSDYEPVEVGISVHYTKILKPHLIAKYRKIYNLHPGYLPWGRGYYPVFWAMWEQTPAGATFHEITAGIDEGPIVKQIRVEQRPDDTGGSLHERVRVAEKELFSQLWPAIVEGKPIDSFPQARGGTYHAKREFFDLKSCPDWRLMPAEDLVRLARALTFPGFTGLELATGDHKLGLSVNRP